ncbi:MAG TPA: aminopeptidase P family protein [Streptosporangiaceae bacterium]|nr:aminopeptidase P family protein [Streptosporangiaceae bacterium]
MTGYRKTSFSTPPSARLSEYMRQGWSADAEAPGVPPAPPAELTARRRAVLSTEWPGIRLIIPAGQPRLRSGDSHYPFRPESNYVWLTGDQTPGGVLVLEAAGATLYVQPPSGRSDDSFWLNGSHGELWVGPRPELADLSERLGIACAPHADLDAILDSLRPDEKSLVLRGADPQIDAAVAVTDADGEQWLRAGLAELRLVKDEWEIGQLRTAMDVSAAGFADAARVLRQATAGAPVGEREVEAAFAHRARAGGSGPGYPTIAAAGWHGTILHWTRNDGPLRPGELIVIDAGAETEALYTADITRTLPVSGTFTAIQREVYEIVLAAQEAALAEIGPGRAYRDYYRAVAQVLAAGLQQLGVLPVSAAESLGEDSGLHRRWTLCAPGHMLGLDVHDCGDAPAETYIDGVLRPGMVLTVEPGLYFQRYDELVPPELRGLGVRIEDDVLVTPDGCELLSAALPRTPGDIETWMDRVAR